MKKSPIDAVATVRSIRDEHAEKLKDATPAERIAFYREQAQRLHTSLGLRPKGEQPAVPHIGR